jgi:hypothetical protein
MRHIPRMQNRPLQRQRLPRRQTPLRFSLFLQFAPLIPKHNPPCPLDRTKPQLLPLVCRFLVGTHKIACHRSPLFSCWIPRGRNCQRTGFFLRSLSGRRPAERRRPGVIDAQPGRWDHDTGTISSRNRRSLPQPRLHLLVPNHPSLLLHHPPARQNHKVRYPPNLKAPGKPRILLRIHLKHYRFPSHLRRCPCNLGRRHPARAAPVRPKIHEHRDLRTLNDFIEQMLVHRQRFGHRRQRHLARPATPRIGQMPARYPVLLSTRSTSTNYRHECPPDKSPYKMPCVISKTQRIRTVCPQPGTARACSSSPTSSAMETVNRSRRRRAQLDSSSYAHKSVSSWPAAALCYHRPCRPTSAQKATFDDRTHP